MPVIISQNNPYLQSAMAAVPIPADAQPAAGTDAEMTIYQPSTDTLWEMWLMSQSLQAPGQWRASWGGRIQHVSLDPGYYRTTPDGAGGYSEQAGWGATASSLPVVGGLITLSDLAAGQINHAVALMVPQAARGIFSFPAQRTDGVSAAANAIPEGARFRLPASLNLAAISMPPITRMIAQAAQTHGLIVDDQTGAAVGFRAEDPTPLMRQGQTNPYRTYFKTSATGGYEDPNFLLASFPWSYLQLVAPGQ